jgi:hypothetical protein
MKTVSISCATQESVTFLIGEEVIDGGRDTSSSEQLKPALIASGVIIGDVELDLMRERLGGHED